MEFKKGDKAFSVLDGVCTCIKISRSAQHTHVWQDLDNACFHTDATGFINRKMPLVITLEAARQLGYDVSKEKKSVSCKVFWQGTMRGIKYPIGTINFTDLIGKTGKLTFEWEE